ncbi:MAG: hypothetical protein ABI925_04590 [Verrucomicrobiota bacterium]
MNAIGRSLLIFTLFFLTRTVGAVAVGQTDTFQDGTTMNWLNGEIIGTPPVINVPNGGPAGAGDHYIQVTSDGSGSGGKLTTFNRDQWLGDYIATGVTSIGVDLLNQSAVSLSIRMAFKNGPGGGASAAGYLTQAMLLPVGSGWQHFTLSLAPANLIAVNNPSPWATFFIGEVRFIHAVGTTSLSGTNVVGQFGIDNIHAVPEPTTTTLITVSLLMFVAGVFRRKLVVGR